MGGLLQTSDGLRSGQQQQGRAGVGIRSQKCDRRQKGEFRTANARVPKAGILQRTLGGKTSVVEKEREAHRPRMPGDF